MAVTNAERLNDVPARHWTPAEEVSRAVAIDGEEDDVFVEDPPRALKSRRHSTDVKNIAIYELKILLYSCWCKTWSPHWEIK